MEDMMMIDVEEWQACKQAGWGGALMTSGSFTMMASDQIKNWGGALMIFPAWSVQ